MKVVFLGTPDFVVEVPKTLSRAGVSIMQVVTGEAKPTGREQVLTETPVALWAKREGVEVLTPNRWDNDFFEKVRIVWKEVDAVVLAAYGKMIPERFLDLPKLGFVNLHPSLLPKFRGASPVAGAIVASEEKTGITWMRMDGELDHGPVLKQEEVIIDKEETSGELTWRLFKMGARKLQEILEELASGLLKGKEQDDAKASFTRRLKREDGFLPREWIFKAMAGEEVGVEIVPPPLINRKIKITPGLVFNLVRGLTPWPGVWTEIGGIGKTKRLKIIKASFEATGKLKLIEVQLEGKKQSSYIQFVQAYGPAVFGGD